jgi:hypothetical protein
MFPECRPLHEELNGFNWIVVEETCVIIATKVFSIEQRIVTHFAGFQRLDAYRVGNFLQPSEQNVVISEVADNCHCRVLEKLVDSSSAHVELEAAVRKSILCHGRKW